MLDNLNKSKRVIGVGYLRTTRGSRVLITLFVVCGLFLLIGILSKVWPIVKITIRPNIMNLASQLDIKIDLDTKSSQPVTRSIPGRIKQLGEDDNLLIQQNLLVKTVNGVSIVFSKDDLVLIGKQSLAKIIPPGSVILADTMSIGDGYWTMSDSGRVFYGNFDVNISYYQELPLSNWVEEIIGIDKDEAVSILSKKAGVAGVDMVVYPSFLANFSKKLPKSKSGIRLTLDID